MVWFRRYAALFLVITGSVVAGPTLVAPGAAAGAAVVSGARPGVQASLRVGSQVLTRCPTRLPSHPLPAAYCGTLRVPLDWQSAGTSPKISVCYRWYPATARGSAAGTVVPVEGGPGYPSILSVAGGYRPMYGPLLRRYNMLAVDLRGTGCSTVLNCPKEQNYTKPSGTLAFARVVGACADALNKRWRAPGGGYVHASDLFTSASAAEDLAAVIRALRLPRIDLYGDSYGSWFAQVFAARYPSLVRSVTLDSTYPVQELDPWYRITIATMPGDFDTVCAQTPACAAVGGSSWPRIEALAHRLARAPVTGTVPGPAGARVRASMGVAGLVNLVSDSAEDPAIYAALDAAARALLGQGQAAPLLRLYASRMASDEAYFGVPVRQYSVGLYMAVSCLDYPQLYPMSASPSARLADLRANEATLPAGTFAPFTTAQWLAMDQNTENYTACLDWPAPRIAQPPIPQSPPFLPRSMPVLILGGSLDTWTPPAGVPEVQAEIGGHSRFVELANETHVVGEGDSYGCASKIIQAFVADPSALSRLNASCAAAVPSVRAVGAFAGRLGAVTPVTLTSGHATAAARRLAAAAVLTAGDAWSRYESIIGNHDTGLYGGSVTARNGHQLTLDGDEFVPGVKVSGTLTVNGTGENMTVAVVLRGWAAGLRTTRVTGSWRLYGGAARAALTLTGGAGSATGSTPAPEGVTY
jgi:pimeloyl-ACP methyl ester carboxylesterase